MDGLTKAQEEEICLSEPDPSITRKKALLYLDFIPI